MHRRKKLLKTFKAFFSFDRYQRVFVPLPRTVSRTCLVKWLYVLSKRSMRFATVKTFQNVA